MPQTRLHGGHRDLAFEGPVKERTAEILKGEGNISIVTKDRRGRGGGVAILFRNSNMQAREYKFKRKRYEMVAVKASIKDVRGPVFIKPSLNAGQKAEILELLTDAINEIKTREEDPKIFVMGDFNKTPTDQITIACPSMVQADSPPTRAGAHLDLIITNVHQKIHQIKATRPLQTSVRIPYGVLTHIAEPDNPPTWNVTKMRPDLSEAELAEELATYFVKITDEFTPVDPENIPLTYAPYLEVEPHQVAERGRSGLSTWKYQFSYDH